MRIIKTWCLLGGLALVPACGDKDAPGGAGGNDAGIGAGGSDSGGSDSGGSDSGGSDNGGSDDAGVSGGSSGGAASTPEGASTSAEVSAEDGGELALDDGAGVSIPAGALGADTEISLEAAEPSADLPEVDSVQGLAYDLGPDGTTFAEPVELTLPLAGEPGEGEEAVVSWLNEETGEWEDLPTTVADGEVIAETTHFTLFVVRFRGVEAGAIDCAFEACDGGDIVGTWKILGACVDTGSQTNPFEESCPEATIDVNSEITGSITFESDGTWESSLTTGGTFGFNIPASCLEAMTGGQVADCQDLYGKDEDESDDGKVTVCTGTTATGCECVQEGPPTTKADSGTYTLDGSTLSREKSDSSVETTEICATDTTLKVLSIKEKDDGSEERITWTGERE